MLPKKNPGKSKSKGGSVIRSQTLRGAAMNYAPVNEMGVVLLFPQIAKRYRIRVDSIQAAFPDCIAYRTIGGKEKRLRIEFEYRSKTFDRHHHPKNECDMIVCWEHDWAECPSNIEVLELRREYGLGFNVWIQPVGPSKAPKLAQWNEFSGWSVAPRAAKGDLVLFYRTLPDMHIADVFRVAGPVQLITREKEKGLPHKSGVWNPEEDHFASIRRVCRLAAPVYLEDLRRHRVLKTAGFVRSQMQGRPNASEYWTYLYDLIVRRNPAAKKPLAKYEPGRLVG